MANKGGSFFTTNKKGEVHELKADLNSNDEAKKVTAVKKVIAAMTVGKDVSMLFVDVLKCMQTNNLELKKLVYLYLMNYAKSMPELAILAVSTFVRDTEDKNPLIRALAIRTMACIRVDQIVEYLGEPLRKCLADSDPYVRKTAAVCVAKLHSVNPDMAYGFYDSLRSLVADSNPMVVANAVASLSEIQADSTEVVFEINTAVLNNLLAAISECTEWGQVFILDALVNYVPSASREGEHIVERILPRLSHANPSVVLSAVKVVILYMDHITNQEFLKTCIKKLGPPLVSLLANEPEIQYVALRNIDLIVQKYPLILRNHMKMFFCKYYDPLYVKVEKIEIMVKLMSARNVDQVLLEFKEYAQEVDVDVVRRAVKAIGRTAIKLPTAAEKCIGTLLSLIQTKTQDDAYAANHVVQEVIIAMKDIFRLYPTQYESVISELCNNLDSLDNPEARAAMVWIVGEYAERISSATEVLTGFLDDWDAETTAVRLQLLTAVVKCFLKRPDEAQDIVQKMLRMATESTLTPDLRDRAYMYWRLLSTDPEAAKVVVLSDKPVIASEDKMELHILNALLRDMACLSSVYHKPPELFLNDHVESAIPDADDDEDELADEDPAPTQTEDLARRDPPPLAAEPAPEPAAPAPTTDLLGSLIDLAPSTSTTPAPGGAHVDLLGDLGDLLSGTSPAVSASVEYPAKEGWLSAQNGKGMEIMGRFTSEGGTTTMEFSITNKSLAPLSGFAVQFNKNSFGLSPAGTLAISSIPPNGTAEAQIQLRAGPEMVKMMSPVSALQVALKNNVGVHYFQALVPLWALFTPSGELQKNPFLELWRSIPDSSQLGVTFEFSLGGANEVAAKLKKYNLYLVALKEFDKNGVANELTYFSAKTVNNMPVLYEITFSAGVQTVNVKAQQAIMPLAADALRALLAL